MYISFDVNLSPSFQVLREGKEFDDLTEVAKLFNLYGDPETEPEEEKDAEESEEKVPM